jgi:hypothetical protein
MALRRKPSLKKDLLEAARQAQREAGRQREQYRVDQEQYTAVPAELAGDRLADDRLLALLERQRQLHPEDAFAVWWEALPENRRLRLAGIEPDVTSLTPAEKAAVLENLRRRLQEGQQPPPLPPRGEAPIAPPSLKGRAAILQPLQNQAREAGCATRSCGSDGRPSAATRLTLDDLALAVTLNGVKHRVADPRAYAVYKAIAEKDAPTITKNRIRTKVKGVRGQKTIPRLIASLPPALQQTVKWDTNGYWIVLP